ncbi:TolC family protein [Pseudodesulfovibrio sp.]|uniref:TolC family protein n=1 Tax=Pseudodesulfovibrio sp. TaxID=2035812 RepID=UPI00261C9D36|nr:TolC family protein [Pseudodesulfovibrio sp.]MDD3312462.1 TolC family protein [Pseudodesulfovibrio sp.]
MRTALSFGLIGLLFACCLPCALAEQPVDVGAVERQAESDVRAAEAEHAPEAAPSGSLTGIPTDDAGYIQGNKIDFLNEPQEIVPSPAPSIPLTGDEKPMTLKEACRLAIRNHPRIESSDADLDEAEADYGIARSQYYPKVDWVTKVGPSRELDTGVVEYGDSAILITQKLFKFGGIQDSVASARLLLQSARLQSARTREDIAVLAINAYLTVLQSQELVRVYEGALSFYKKLLESFRVRYAGGISSLADAQKVEVSLRDAEAQVVRQNEQFSTSRSLLENIIDTPVASVEPNVNLLHVSIDGSIEESYQRALGSNRKLQALVKQIDAQTKSVNASEADYYPELGYRLQLKNEFQQFKAANKCTQTAEAQLTLDWNLFNGFSTTNEVTKKKAVLRRLKASTRGAELEIRNVLTDAMNSYASSASEYKLAKEAFDSSVSLMSLYLSEFDLGIRTLLDLTSARDGQTNAAVREVNARFTRIRAALNILLEEGRLESVLQLPLEK